MFDTHIFIFTLKLSVVYSSALFEKYWLTVIPNDYDKYSPPSCDDKPVTVYINLEIMDVDDIKETTMDFRMHLYETERWKDPRLMLRVLNLTATKVLPPVAATKIWIPDIVFDNSKWGQLFQFSIPNTALKIHVDETIEKISRYSFRVQCRMDLHYYPIDIQRCAFKIGYLTITEKLGLLEWSDAENSPYKNLGPSISLKEDIQPLKYEMKMPKPYKTTEYWINGNFCYLMANFTFIRRLTGSIINAYVPSTLVVGLSWLSFWLDANAVPARITLGVTSILTLITQVVQSRSYAPTVNYIKAIDIWLFTCTSFVAASLLEYALAHQYTTRKSRVRETPSSQCNNTEKWVTNLKNSKEKLIEIETKRKQFLKMLKPKKSDNNFDHYSRFVFPITFLIFSISYWWYFLQYRSIQLA